MPNLRERPPKVTTENGLIRIHWQATGRDGASVVQTGEQDALTPYVAMQLAQLLIRSVEEFQNGNEADVLDMRAG